MLCYNNANTLCHHEYVLPTVLQQLRGVKRVLDIGCGNGSADKFLADCGFEVTAIDNSETGIAVAQRAFPNIRFAVANCYDNLATTFGTFPAIISLEVIEHLYSPREFIRRAHETLTPDGRLILSTPYNGYLKNVALALTNRFDRHHDPLWDHGHIKFWSMATLQRLLHEEGFYAIKFYRVGRIPPFAKSMIAVAKRRA